MKGVDSRAALTNPRTLAIADILSSMRVASNANIVVVGCGSGREAAILADRLQARVTGIDIVNSFDPAAAQWATLQIGDAQAMDFPDATFDVVFSYHALEHIPDHHKALLEMRRVLKPEGIYCIGTPNRARALGYLGDSSSVRQKISWNLSDWKARLLGRFRNELGAHAGYTSSELKGLLLEHFSTADEATQSYYQRLYPGRRSMVDLLVSSGIWRVVFPSVYFVGRR